jgi:hypothetical protein
MQLLVVGDANAPQKIRDGKEDRTLIVDGKPVTLLDALRTAVSKGEFGKGALVELDVDGQPVK